MRVVLVGQFKGHRQVRWLAAILLACSLGVISASITAGAYFALSGAFSVLVAMVGFIGPLIIVGSGIMQSLQLPVEQLTRLDRIGK